MRAGEPVGEPIHGSHAVDADRRLYVRPCVMDFSSPLLQARIHELFICSSQAAYYVRHLSRAHLHR